MLQIAGSARCGGIAGIGIGHVSRLSSCPGSARSAGQVDGSGILQVMHDDVTRQAHAAIVARDWAGLRPLLHPYLHWTDTDGTIVRGRSRVMAMLDGGPVPPPPTSVELRDGQIYRWR
jgi:hypothetical protein